MHTVKQGRPRRSRRERVAHVAGGRGRPSPYPHPATWGVEHSSIANGDAPKPGWKRRGRGGLPPAARRAVGWARP